MELQIDGQHIEVHDDLRETITHRLEKLNSHHEDIIHARVTLVKSGHHQHGSDEARIFLSMPRRKVLQVSKIGKTLEDAINSALDALQRELSEYRSRRREVDKQLLKTAKAGSGVTGKVSQIFSQEGYGFVDIGADQEVRFSRQSVVGEAFEAINEGTSVEIDVIEIANGYEATRVVPIQP